jgi:general secretion pathway protein A
MRQRVTLAYPLRPFTRDETAAYLQHHLQQVGVDRPVFTDAAITSGHEWAQGLPRRINRWAQACLLASYGAQPPWVDERMVAWRTRSSSGRTPPRPTGLRPQPLVQRPRRQGAFA